MKKKVVIYTWKTCIFCIRAKRLLKNKGVEFEEIDIGDDINNLRQLETKTGSGTVPQIFVEGKYIGGCDDIVNLQRRNKFDTVFN
ncbi:MAG: glutaredoxin 3 [Clostridiales bacterium]|nr:glutaredoxin 3 [Clostridiales bacterium]